jgi:probable rRNA maturation factor
MAVFIADEQTRPVDADRLRRLTLHVLTDQRVPPAMEVSILCVDRGAMAELNAAHMSKQGPTDVLAFPIDLPGETAPGEPPLLGDVVLCPDVAAEQAAAHNKSLEAELDLLLVHGLLHLLGHDHAEPRERDRMFALTNRLLAGFAEAGAPADSGGQP